MGELEGRVCVVTGAGRGIGRHIAETFAGAGADLGLCARTAAELEAARAAIVERQGVRVVARPVDVASAAELEQFAAAVVEGLGRVDVLVNNAGVYGPVGPLVETDWAAWEHAVRIDLFGVAHAIRAFAPRMTGGGSIVNLGGGGIGGPGTHVNVSAYTAAKAGVVVLTETLARELAPAGIRVNALAPGAISTRIVDTVIEAGPERAGAALHDSSVRQRAGGDPIERVGAAALFLATARSGALTGRLVSAKWDPLDEIEAVGGELPPSRYTLRRIDGVMFGELLRSGS